MSKYKYVTPSWIDSFRRQYDVNNEAYSDSYVITELEILNDNAEEIRISIYFYDQGGNEFEYIRIFEYLIPARNKLFLRLGDHIEGLTPNYRNQDNYREGWLKIISPEKLAISGKITRGSKLSNGGPDDVCWTIPFFETPLESLGTVFEPIDTGNEPIDPKGPFGGKFPRPFPPK
jgi:hypothetical protein